MSTLIVEGTVLDEIEERCRAGRPCVASGVLLGRREAAGARVLAHWSPALEGEGSSRVSPRAYRTAEASARARGLVPVGTYHAHLDRGPAPTELDHEDALEDAWLLILAVAEDGAVSRGAYRRRSGSDWLESSGLSVDPAP